MRRALRVGLVGAAIIGSAGAVMVAANPVAAQRAGAGSFYHATLDALNGGAQGEAVLILQGRTLTVHISATGLEPGGVHLGHIHGLSSGRQPVDSRCPTVEEDTDADGFIELLEGVPVYGAILVDFGNVDPDLDGTVDFTTTVELSGQDVRLPLNKRHVVIHGMSVGTAGAGTPGEVDGVAGYKLVLPVLCGEIEGGPPTG